MKLELKHITPYLPYELKIYEPLQSKGLILDLKMTTYNLDRIGLPFLFEHGFYKIQYGLPILRPLIDFYEDVEGVSFSDMVSAGYHSEFWHTETFDLKYLQYTDFEKLVSKHADMFGLIEKGLAIDVNTLKD